MKKFFTLKTFIATILICFIIRLLLAVWLPFTGDEAYYAIWGLNPALGYYDHTPFIGWLLYAVLKIGYAPWIIRLPSILLPIIIAPGIYYVLKEFDQAKAIAASIIFLLIPLSLIAPFITTDIPLIIFSFYATFCLYFALKHNNHSGLFLLSGIFLGLAFLSKYFAVLLGLAFFIYYLFHAQSLKRTLGFVILFASVLPAGILNIYWNYHHDWANILFNVINRNEQMSLNWYDPLIYLLFLFYIITPPVFYYLLKYVGLTIRPNSNQAFRIFSYSFVIPVVFFIILSFFKSIGLHWVFSFIPFAFILIGYNLSEIELRKIFNFEIFFSGIQLILILLVLILPVTVWQKFGLKGEDYTRLVYFFDHKQVRDQLNQYNDNHIFACYSYAIADMMYYDSGKDSVTFGVGSVHGRQGDFLTDFKKYDGKDFIIIDTSYPDMKMYTPYFKSLEVKQLDYKNAKFYYVIGHDFNYAKYRDVVLRYIYQTYWQVPKFLPIKSNFYGDKYSF